MNPIVSFKEEAPTHNLLSLKVLESIIFVVCVDMDVLAKV
jgi:hypothetical protein